VEARARAAQLSRVSYDIELDLTHRERFGSRVTVRFDSRGSETFLELTAAEDLRVEVNGEPADTTSYDGRRIALTGLRERNEVVVEARLPYVTDGDGMHTFTDPADGERYVSAYVGMDLAQKVFACFDQNDLKAPLGLRVVADPAWTVLGNGLPVFHQEDAWEFATTPPIPVALFVVCAGPWHSVTWEHRGLPFGWHARRSLAAELDRDAPELRSTTEACFDHYAEIFDEPYPFDSFDQAFVPGLNWGAQEMPGCVTYRDEYLPAGRITDHQRSSRAMTIAHEMAHMWFGDLVTMVWWEDTWLQESFADYMGFRVAEEAAGFVGSQVSFEVQRKPGAYDADERRSTHPVAAVTEEVVDVDTAFGNFDSISYAKGNSVIRQLVTWLGDDDFLAGVNTYLTRHRFANATLDDFVDALGSATDRDARGWVEAWLRTTGFDTIRVERDQDVPVLVREGSRPHRVRVTAYDDRLRERGTRLVDLAAEPVRLDDWAGRVVVPNTHGETFARVRFDELSWSALSERLSTLDDDLARAVVWATTYDLVRCGELGWEGMLDLVVAQLPRERHPAVVEGVLGRLRRHVLPLQVPADRAAQANDLVARACRAGLDARPGVQLEVAFTQGLASTSRDHALLRGWLADDRTATGLGLDPDLRWQVLHRLAETGGADEDLVRAEAARDPSARGELGAARARAAVPDAAAKEAAWTAMSTDEAVSNRMFDALGGGLWSPEQADLLAPYVERYFREGPEIAERRGQAFSQVVGYTFPRVHLSDAQVTLLEQALAAGPPTVLQRWWEDSYDDVVRARGGNPQA
jgi:aminopeptidase N